MRSTSSWFMAPNYTSGGALIGRLRDVLHNVLPALRARLSAGVDFVAKPLLQDHQLGRVQRRAQSQGALTIWLDKDMRWSAPASCWRQLALLHKLEWRRGDPHPRRSYAMAATSTVIGHPSCVKRLSSATRTGRVLNFV